MNNETPAAVLERARLHIAFNSATSEKKEAFARSVAYLVTGWATSTSWPSAREAVVRRRFACSAGRFSFEEACELLISEHGLIFGPVQDVHREVFEEEMTGNNDSEDLRILTK